MPPNKPREKTPPAPPRAPPRREWPHGLRRVAREQRLYRELDLLRRLSPSTLLWLIEHWDTPEGASALARLQEGGAHALAALPGEGG